MAIEVLFSDSTVDCEHKLLMLERQSDKGCYTLKAIKIKDYYNPPRGATTDIQKIVEILKNATTVQGNQSKIESVVSRVKVVKRKHNHGLILQLFKRILPRFLINWLPFQCLKLYQGLDQDALIAKMAQKKGIEAEPFDDLEVFTKEGALEGRIEEVDRTCRTKFGFSPKDYLLANPQKSKKELQKELNLRISLAEAIQEVVGAEDLKESLELTVDHLCAKHHVDDADIEKEARLIGKDAETAKMKMVKRLTVYLKAGLDPALNSPSLARRQEATGYEISILKWIEKAFADAVHRGDKAVEVESKDHAFSLIISGTDVIVGEGIAGTGAFKVAVFASDYFELKSPEERKQYVTIRMLKGAKNNRELKLPTSQTSEFSSQASESSSQTSGSSMKSQDAASLPDEESTSEKPSILDRIDLGEDEGWSSTVVKETPPRKKMGKMKNGSGRKKRRSVPDFMNVFNYDYDDPQHLKGMPYEKWKTGALKRALKSVQHEIEAPGKEQDELKELKEQETSLLQLIEERNAAKAEMIAYQVPGEMEEYLQEIEVTKMFQGPGVVELHRVVDLASGEKVMIQKAAGYPFEKNGVQKKKNVIDLKDLIELRNKGELTDQQKSQLMAILDDAFLGLERMHAKGYIHRDLKPENILVAKDGRGALTDFGTVCKATGDPAKSRYFGTPRYSSPEFCAYADHDTWKSIDEKCDVWSVGMILMECCFEGLSTQDHRAINYLDNPEAIRSCLIDKILKPSEKAIYDRLYVEPQDQLTLEHLVWEATRIDPEDRPTMAEFRAKFNRIRQRMGLDA